MTGQPPHHLGDIGFQLIPPSPSLQPFVQWFWAIHSNGAIPGRRSEFMHANGSLSLLFNWGDELLLNNGARARNFAVGSIGLVSQQLILPRKLNACGVLFRPGGAFPVLGVPMRELANIEFSRTFKLDQLYDRLSCLATLDEKIEYIESWLTRLLEANHPSSTTTHAALMLFRHFACEQTIGEIAQRVNLSERQLERLFGKEVGLSPKQYARLIRLQRARHSLKQSTALSLTDISHTLGYYDQAHFNREFKALIGITPGDYLCRLQNRQPAAAE